MHISTGDALRAQVSAGTDLGKMANDYMTKGALVPDELIIDIVKDRLAQPDCARKGWLLDGFPRTGVQAEAMKKAGITADHFILLNVPDQVLTERCDLVWAHGGLFWICRVLLQMHRALWMHGGSFAEFARRKSVQKISSALTYTQTKTNTNAQKHERSHTHMHARAHAHTHTDTHTNTRTHTHSLTHTHTHASVECA